ncbi:hypothetical protein HK101_010984 [Irineochytrium annulatum]|nr:hypothetical protein HK101_010984 [Irineochytrium annulatum]
MTTAVTFAQALDDNPAATFSMRRVQRDLASAARSSPTRSSTPAVANLLTTVAHDIAALKRHGNPMFSDVQVLAERTWRATVTAEAQIERLTRERESLNRQVDELWAGFDVLIRPLWRIDDALVPVYERLADTRMALEQLKAWQDAARHPVAGAVGDKAGESQQIEGEGILREREPSMASLAAEDRENKLLNLQTELHAIENERVVDGKFVPEAWKVGMPVPGGQAVLANLLARCYKLVRQLQEHEPGVAPHLYPIESRLLNIISTLTAFKYALLAGSTIDPIELRLLQEHVDKIDSARVDGKFLDEDGRGIIPEGQAILTGLLEEAYELIHECLIEVDARQGEEPVDEVEVLLERMRSVKDIVTDYVKRTGAAGAGGAMEKAKEATAQEGSLDAAGNEKAVTDKPATKTVPDEHQSTVTELGSSALSALRDTLGEGFSYIKATAGKLEDGVASTVTSAQSRLASLTRSGLAGMSRLLGGVDPVDPSLAKTHERLLQLKGELMRIRNERDGNEAARLAEETEENKGGFGHVGRRMAVGAQLSALDEMDEQRDEDGNFLNDEGGVPRGQNVLKSLYEECYLLSYDLLR